MRKIRIDKNTSITGDVIKWVISKHKAEKDRISELMNYYNNNNTAINNRSYDDNKPSNKLSHPFASYITNMAVGYFLGKPISYNSNNSNLLSRINDVFKYNDEADNNTTLAKYSSICGYAVELIYADEDSNARFKAIPADEVAIVYDNTLEENILCAVRYFDEEIVGTDKTKTTISVYTSDEIQTYELKDEDINLIESELHYFQDVPVVVYINNDELYGDFEKVKSLIDAYDQAQSDTANDFEYFTNALLVISGILVDDENGLDFKNNRVLNFTGSEGKAEYLIKNINDSALENFKNRLVEDIHKFSQIPNLTDEQFAGNVSGESMKYKLMGLENITGLKEAKFKKGLMRRIELLCNFLNLATNDLMLYTDIQPIFTRNKPKNEVELANMVKGLYGILSDETLISILPFIENSNEEIEKRNKEKESTLDYQELGVEYEA
jgi:SPP1 family phage portal protein|nr:MAG TPA: PORTAL PROTEIN [Caudoviricetes sp.]